MAHDKKRPKATTLKDIHIVLKTNMQMKSVDVREHVHVLKHLSALLLYGLFFQEVDYSSAVTFALGKKTHTQKGTRK